MRKNVEYLAKDWCQISQIVGNYSNFHVCFEKLVQICTNLYLVFHPIITSQRTFSHRAYQWNSFLSIASCLSPRAAAAKSSGCDNSNWLGGVALVTCKYYLLPTLSSPPLPLLLLFSSLIPCYYRPGQRNRNRNRLLSRYNYWRGEEEKQINKGEVSFLWG